MRTAGRSSPAVLIVLAAAACSGSSAGCGHSEWDRRETLRQALIGDNRALFEAAPDRAEARIGRMAREPFAYFRGSARLYAGRDEATRFAPPAPLAVMGDAHPENVALVPGHDGEAPALEFNDFDLAGFGSPIDDLRRLAVGFWLIGQMGASNPRKCKRLAAAVAEGYEQEISALAAGQEPVSLRVAGTLAAFIAPALEKAAPDEGDAAARGVPVNANDRRLIEMLLAAYDNEQRPLRLVRAVVVHAGIGSYLSARYRVVVEHQGAEATLDIKEAPGRSAARIVAITREFQERPDRDPWLGSARVGDKEYLVRGVAEAGRRLDASHMGDQLRKKRWTLSDLERLGALLGHLLARGHAGARGPNGAPGLRAIAATIGRDRGLVQETMAFADRRGDDVLDDWKRLKMLVRETGPRLGWAR